ncbi:L,D-transpeptidase [Nonomuraea roseoviolacea]|uniref:Lipoprotein-anchoring transpeptidase ErfK/SrfK n=1 Tax=Nonomuraea roseoviolacea subsp. carminata TaxID=160689 RepID=A0ABT1JZW0_9ACTN|nr:L,D-transpeptidase [Nonomuraea roseoviolacea]MCP2347293.1 lipoprotein-anchoring transpeptidase ErfK/SrfK [Nonomuraea roseoviolacea subsp. carminata]
MPLDAPRQLVGAALVAMSLAASIPAAAAASPATPAAAGSVTATALPAATTFTQVNGLPQDTDTYGKLSGLVVHPARTVAVYAQPGGTPAATLPAKQLGSQTWVPVVEARKGWYRVLLPSKPNHVTGWISAKGLKKARSRHRAIVKLGTKQLIVMNASKKLGTWTVAVGGPETPTPVGRTFLLALMSPKKKTYSPLILPLGTHSQTLDTFGGGPGTVAFHGWPDRKVFGKAVTHGCVRVPAGALKVLARLPLGTPVLIAP